MRENSTETTTSFSPTIIVAPDCFHAHELAHLLLSEGVQPHGQTLDMSAALAWDEAAILTGSR
jgi:hypothetical protein